jgi:competence protein ComEA
MKAGRVFNGWWVVAILLVAVIIAGSMVIWSGHRRGAIEISVAPERSRGDIYVDGEVNNPGIYPLKAGDSLEDIIQAAGGATASADISRLELRVPALDGMATPQKVNINRAEAWLLMALPGIGEDRAQAIIDYRRQGLFRSTGELLRVEGIGISTYEKIKDLITVTDQ